ncbi:beta strand repeat-containing protein, partial [Magnetococcales bacterium HHB-1]
MNKKTDRPQKRKTSTRATDQDTLFDLETLEERILLSADPVLTEAIQDNTQNQNMVPGEHIILDDSEVSSKSSDLFEYDPTNKLSNLFEGLDQSEKITSFTDQAQALSPFSAQSDNQREDNQQLYPGDSPRLDLTRGRLLSLDPMMQRTVLWSSQTQSSNKGLIMADARKMQGLNWSSRTVTEKVWRTALDLPEDAINAEAIKTLNQGLNQGKLDFSGFNESLFFDVDEDGQIKITVGQQRESSLLAYGFDHLIGGLSDDHFLFAEDFTGNFTTYGGLGADTLEVSGEDSLWNITGLGSGDVGDINFGGFENLWGGVDNEDVFVLGADAHIEGVMHGNDRGFDTLVLNGGVFENITYEAFSPASGIITRDGHLITYDGLEPIIDTTITTDRTVNMSTGDDTDATLNDAGSGSLILAGSTFEDITFIRPSNSLTIQGLAGNDQITLGSMDLDDIDLTVNAEKIILSADATITTTGDITLNAENSYSKTSGSDATIDLTAQIEIYGTLEADDIILSSAISSAVDLSSNAIIADMDLVSTTKSNVLLYDTAVVNASTLDMQATTEIDYQLSAPDTASGKVDINTTQSTYATIASGASVTLGTTSISTSEPASLRISASDQTDLITLISSDDSAIAALTGFDILIGEIDLSRDTQAGIGSLGNTTTLTGKSNNALGGVVIRASNQDGDGGGIQGTVNSGFVGVQNNKASKDDAKAWLYGVDTTLETLEIKATNSSTYTADSKVAKNSVTGETKATLADSTITATKGSTTEGILIHAKDTATYSALADDFAYDLSFFSSIDLSIAGARNFIDKEISALILGDNDTITVDGGLIDVQAINESTLKAVAKAQNVIYGNVLTNSYSLSLGGSYVGNFFTGDITAGIQGLSATNITSTIDITAGDINVNADNSAIIHAEAEATTKVTGGSGSAVGVTVSFNAIGWKLDNFFTASFGTLFGLDSGLTEDAVDTQSYIKEATVTASGDVDVTATSEMQLNATVSNTSKTSSSSLFDSAGTGMSSMGVGAIIAANRVSGSTSATVSGSTRKKIAAKDLTITATDNSAINSNSKMVASAMIASNGSNLFAELEPADYDSDDGKKTLTFGDRVRLANEYTNGGNADSIYEYLGSGESIDLSKADYSDKDQWREVSLTRMFPEGLHFSATSSASVGGMVVMNQVAGDVTTTVDNMEISAEDMVVSANEKATITATADSTAESASKSAFGSGMSLAVNGVIATNIVTNSAIAKIKDSEITTTDDLTVDVDDSATITATTKATTTGDNAVGVVLAFNSIGWEAMNIFSLSADAIVGSNIGTKDTSEVDAIIQYSTLDIGGDLVITADNLAKIEASVSNSATAASKSLLGGNSAGISALIASNMISSSADASITFDNSGTVSTGGLLTVSAEDQATINAKSNMSAISSLSNDGGSSMLGGLIDAAIQEYRYSSLSGRQSLEEGDGVRVASTHTAGGVAGGTYKYIGSDATLNLGTQDYSNTSKWERLTRENFADFMPLLNNLTGGTSVAVGAQFVRNDIISDVSSSIKNSTITAGGTVTVKAEESADISAAITGVAESGDLSPFGVGTSVAVNATIATNTIIGDVIASVDDSQITITGGDLIIDADNTAGIDVKINSSTSSGGVGVGATMAFNTLGWKTQDIFSHTIDAFFATNIGDPDKLTVQAYLNDTTVNVSGKVSVTADQKAKLNATVSNAASSEASALVGAQGGSGSGIFASNMVNGAVKATIDFSSTDRGVITAGSNVDVLATNDAALYANTKMVSSSVTTSDGGATVLKETIDKFIDADFLSSDGVQTISFGEKVRLSSDYSNGGEGGAVYKFMGKSKSVDLSSANYENEGWWIRENPTDFVPELNITSSSSYALGGIIIRNDLRSQVTAKIDHSKINSGSLNLKADEKTILKAITDSNVVSSGGSSFGLGGESFAGNLIVANNLLLGGSEALLNDSEVTTTVGDIIVSSENSNTIDARSKGTTESGGSAGTGTLAFNTSGWKPQNIFADLINTLIGASAFGDEDPVSVKAHVLDSTLDAKGDISVTALNDATVHASLTNKSEAAASSLINDSDSSTAVGFVVAANKLSVNTEAYIDSSTTDTLSVKAGGALSVTATEDAHITARTKLESIATTKIDAGASLAFDLLDRADDIEYTDRSGSQTLNYGDVVKIGDADYTTFDEPTTIKTGDQIELEFSIGGGAAGDIYQYIGTQDLTNVDLDEENYKDSTRWRKTTGDKSARYIYQGTSGATVDLGSTDFSNSSLWYSQTNLVDLQDAFPALTNISQSDATSVGILFTHNAVNSSAKAYMDHIKADAAGTVTVKAVEDAFIKAQDKTVAEAQGGSLIRGGGGLAINGVIVSNNVVAKANAYVTDSDITTTNLGDIIIQASNTEAIKASISSKLKASGKSIGVVLAFNTMGWKDQNFLFDAVDALIGFGSTSIGDEDRAEVNAYAKDSTLNAAGGVSVTATMDAEIEARIVNSATSISANLTEDSTAISIAPVIALNKTSTDVAAYIENATTLKAATGDLTVKASDDSSIEAIAQATSIGIAASVKGSTAVTVGFSMAHNRIDNDVLAHITNAGSSSNPVVVGNDLTISADRSAVIDSTTTATSVAVAAGMKNSPAVGGGGSIASNLINGGSQAYLKDSVMDVTGDVSVTTANSSKIDANIRSVAVAVSVSGQKSVGVAVGISLARNIIGAKPKTVTHTYDSTKTDLKTLNSGDIIKIKEGVLTGEVYEYVGDDYSKDDPIDLASQNYADTSAWKRLDISDDPAMIKAYISDSSVDAEGDMVITADAKQSINAKVLAIAAAAAASGQNSVGVSAAGVYAQNRIANHVKAYIDGDGDSGIESKSLTVTATDQSSIDAIAGAASLSASISGQTGVAVSVGLSLSFNTIKNDVEAYISNADKLVTTDGDVILKARSTSVDLYSLNWSDLGFTADDLDDASVQDQDDPDDPNNANDDANDTSDDAVNEFEVDKKADEKILDQLLTKLTAQGLKLSKADTINAQWTYVSSEEESQDLKEGTTVKIDNAYQNGGVGGRIYRFIAPNGEESSVDLGNENYADTSRWELVKPEVRISKLEQGEGWLLVDGDGTSYTLLNRDGKMTVAKNNINAVSVAASMGVGIGGTTGVSVSGAGAVAINTLLGRTDAYIKDSGVKAAGDIDLAALNTARVNTTIVAASLSVGAGATTGVGVSIGIAVARNMVGYQNNDQGAIASVRAYILDSDIDATGDLFLSASANQTINALVLAGSAAVGGGGTTGVAVSGSGVWAENKIGVDVEASITGDIDEGIKAKTITLTATDKSTISAFAGAASLAASFAGTAGVSVSIGASIARNLISTEVESFIKDVDQGVTTTGGALILKATSDSSIDAVSAAASVAAGFAGTAGVGVSGAGASARNTILTKTNAFIDSSDIVSAGKVDLDAKSTSKIKASIIAASVAIGGGGAAGVGASVGVAIARNYIGWNPESAATSIYTLADDPSTIKKGDTVKITSGVRQGDVYKYLGSDDLSKDGDSKLLLTQDYSDDTIWEKINLEKANAEIQAYIKESSIDATGALSATAIAEQRIKSLVLSGSVALSGGGAAGVSVSGAGASAKNFIGADVKAFIKGNGSEGIKADSLTLRAEDNSSITTVVGAASVAASFGGAAGVSVSIGVAIAKNHISNNVEAYLSDIDQATIAGDVIIQAKTLGEKLFTVDKATSGVTADELDNASVADEDNPDTSANEADNDKAADKLVLTTIRTLFKDQGFEINSEKDIRVSKVDEGALWLLVAEDEGSYFIKKDGENFQVSRTTIDAVSVAASVGIAIGGAAGVSVSGAGAVAKNVILTDTEAYIKNSQITALGKVDLDAASLSDIAATVGALSASIGGGGAAGVGVSIGVAISKNYLGQDPDDSSKTGEISAYTLNSDINATGALTLDTLADQRISAKVLAASAALAAGGAAGVGVAGSGVGATNIIETDIQSYINGDKSSGITAGSVSLSVDDQSSIIATAGAASIAASFGGAAGVSVSVGASIAKNIIDNQVKAYIINVDQGVITTSGDLSIITKEQAKIKVVSAAAAVAVGGGGVAGVGVAGAGTSAKNIIMGDVKAYIKESTIQSANDLIITADNEATIDASIVAAAFSLGGGTVGAGASIGIALARNYVGYDPTSVGGATYKSSDSTAPSSISYGDYVEMADSSGVRAGDLYRYIGKEDLKNELDDDKKKYFLTDIDYGDTDKWEQIVSDKPAYIQAYILESDVTVGKDLTISATNKQTIKANVFSGSMAVSGGLVAGSLSGAGVGSTNKIAAKVQAFIKSSDTTLDILKLTGSGTITASDQATITSNSAAVAVAAAFGAGAGSISVGVSVAQNSIANQTTAAIDYVDLTGSKNLSLSAQENASIDAESYAAALAASVGIGFSFAGGGAVAINSIDTITQSYIEDSTITLAGDLSITAENSSEVKAKIGAASASFGLISAALAGTVGTVELNPLVDAYIDDSTIDANDIDISATGSTKGDVNVASISVSTGGSMGVSMAKVTDKAKVKARLNDDVKIKASALRMVAQSEDYLNLESIAASGGIFAGIAGSYNDLDLDGDVMVEMGDDNEITVDTLRMQATNDQDFDSKAHNLAVGLLAGSGALIETDVDSSADIILGEDNQVTALTIMMGAINRAVKNRHANSKNLKSGSAGLISLSALLSDTDIGSESNPYRAQVTIGDGSTLTVLGDSKDPGIFEIETLASTKAQDSVEVIGVGALAISIAESDVKTHSLSAIELDGATLENKSGDIFLTTRSEGKARPGSNLTAAGAVTGGGSISTGEVDVQNVITVKDATIKAADVNIYAGKNTSGVGNLVAGSTSNANMTLASLIGVGVPIPTLSIEETNKINIQGRSFLQAAENVNLITKTGVGKGGESKTRGMTDGLVVSISLIPYAIDVPDGTSDITSNVVTVDATSQIEAGINNQSLLHILPLTLDGESQFDSSRLGTQLTIAEKKALGLAQDLEFEYAALTLDSVGLFLTEGDIIKAVSGSVNKGVVGAYYKYSPGSEVTDHQRILEEQNFSDTSIWTKITPDHDLNDGAKTVTLRANDMVVDEDGNWYRYAGNGESLYLDKWAFTDTKKWKSQTAYASDKGKTFAQELSGKFYMIKPVKMDDPKLIYANISNMLFDQRKQILSWMTSHAGNAEAIARYQEQLDQIDETLKDLGLATNLNSSSGSQTVVKQNFDQLFLDIPNIYASPGSIFIDADSFYKTQLELMVDKNLVARSGAQLDVVNKTPFGLRINDLGINDSSRVESINGQLTTLEPGNVFFNNESLTSTSSATDTSAIKVVQDAYAASMYDVGDIKIPDSPQDMYILGSVVNSTGSLHLENKEGSINVSGEIRAESITLAAQGDFTLNSEGWYHTNRDPRQYTDYTKLSNQVYSESGYSDDKSWSSYDEDPQLMDLKSSMEEDKSRILAMGDINISARYLNVNGLIQSGVDTITLRIDEDFAPIKTTTFTDDSGDTIDGISFGADDIPVDGYFDAEKQMIVVDKIAPDGGKINLTGQILSTGNGRLKVASGYASVDIVNESTYALALDKIDVEKERVGKITIVDSTTLRRTIYTVVGDQIEKTVKQGTLYTPPANSDEVSSITYETVSSKNYDLDDSITYQPSDGLYYVWTEGQEKTQTYYKLYRNSSFDLGFVEVDAFAKDGEIEDESTEFRDQTPLLESELAVIMESGDIDPGTVYRVDYEQRDDVTVKLVKDVSQVRDKNSSSGPIYRYVGDTAQLELSKATFTDTSLWTFVKYDSSSSWEDVDNQKYDSDYVNYQYLTDSWTEGGGFLKKVHVYYEETEITGLKDFYTHYLKADHAIDITFTKGLDTPEINIETPGELYLLGDISIGGLGATDENTLPENLGGGIAFESDTIIANDDLVISGDSPDIISNSSIKITVENARGVLNVKAKGDIEIDATSSKGDSNLVIGQIIAEGGDVTIDSKNGVYGGTESRIDGDRIEIDGGDGRVKVNVDSNLGERGGLAVKAKGDINLIELDGDVRLLDADGWDGASIESSAGDITLITVDGAIYDLYHEDYKPQMENEDGTLTDDAQAMVDAGFDADKVRYTLSPSVMEKIYPHTDFLGLDVSAPAEETNISGDNITIKLGGTKNRVGLFKDRLYISDPENFATLDEDK